MTSVTFRYTVEKLCHHKPNEYKQKLTELLQQHTEYLNKINTELTDINVVIQYMVQLDNENKE